ncbi:MAG: 7TM diverse intracellular signaling domain-containing protein [Pseudomonas sp.]
MARCGWLLLLCCSYLLGSAAYGAAAPGLSIDDSSQRINLTPYLLLLEDPDGQLGLDNLLAQPNLPWVPVKGRYTNTGKNDSAWWLKFELHNLETHSIQGVVEINYPILDRLELYHLTEDNHYELQRSGDHMLIENRPLQLRNPWMKVELRPGVNPFYLRVETSSTVFVPLYFATWPAAASHLEINMLANGLFYGVLIGLFAYNLFLFISLRETTYLWYLIYNLNMLLFMAAFDGLLWKWLPVGIAFQSVSIYSLMFMHCIVATQFSRHFLHTAEHFKRLDRLLLAVMVLVGITLISLPLIGLTLYNLLASLYVLASSALLLCTGIYVWRQGLRYGSYYTLAWGMLLCTLMLSTAGSLGYELAISYGTDWVKLGICVELFILSLGLADRINALKEARFNADEQARQARLESRAQGRFLAKMSHEIRTPLNGVLGMLQLLRDTRLDANQRFYVDTINSSGNALISVINDILDYARIESGHIHLEQIEFDLDQLLSDTTSLFTAQALNKKLGVYCSIDPALPRHFIGDPTRLKQVLLNLLSNGFKFTESGHISLTVEPTGVPRPEQWQLSFSVTDTGIGIKADAQQNLFDSFIQADSSTTRRYGGSGLGLTISQELVKLLGGEIQVQSTPGKGARFHFTIPLVAAPTAVDQQHSAIQQQAMLYCDLPEALACYERVLERCGYDVSALKRGDGSTDRLSEETRGHLLVLSISNQDSIPDLAPLLASRSEPTLVICGPEVQQLLSQEYSNNSLHLYTAPITPCQMRDALQQIAHPAEDATAQNREPVTAIAKGDGQRVMLAEDNPVNQLVVKGLLEKHGYVVEIVHNGLEALDDYITKPDAIQLILMDGEMPIMDGFEATRRIRAHEQAQRLRAVPIVALTAHILDSHRQAGAEAGMNAFLAKPVQGDELLALLAQLLKADTSP